MTFWDDPETVINHIRHSCVTSDDTGMCEMVIVKDEPEIHVKQRRRLGGIPIDENNEFGEYSHSFDIAVSPNLTGRTPKSSRGNDKGRKKNDENQCVNIQWKDKADNLRESERASLFKKKSPIKAQQHQSLLSQLVSNVNYQPDNVFVEYSKFNGEGVEDTCPTHYLNIFLSFLPEKEQVTPMSITVLSTACVQEVIGLVLYKYTAEGRVPRAQKDVKLYSLLIAEDDGEVDMDFPALDEKELITKFGFQFLAVVEKDTPAKPQPSPTKQSGTTVVTVNVPGSGFSRVKVDRPDIKMKNILSNMMKKRGLKKAGRRYVLERQDTPGKAVDMEQTLDAVGTCEFRLLREGKQVQAPAGVREEIDSSYVQADLMSFQYKSYRVLLVQHRLLSTTDIQLGVHGRRIDIDPLNQTKSTKFWHKIKPISLDMNCIADSEIIEEKAGKTSFRIHYKKENDFKHFDFEAQKFSVADEIVKKINTILNSRVSGVRSEFISLKQRKNADRVTKKH
eukprot:gene5895-6580_t